MTCSLHLLHCDALPSDDDEEQEVIVVEGDEPLPTNGVHEKGTFRFVSTVLANYVDLRQLAADVEKYWSEAVGENQRVRLELLTEDPGLLTDDTLEVARRLRPGYWNHGGFIGFLASSESAYNQARSIAIEASMRTQ
jgi:hypothetical protein